MPDFLLEIGCEEIPARMIASAQQELQRRVGDLLNRERLAASGEVTSFETPRRLAVLASARPPLVVLVSARLRPAVLGAAPPPPAVRAVARLQPAVRVAGRLLRARATSVAIAGAV